MGEWRGALAVRTGIQVHRCNTRKQCGECRTGTPCANSVRIGAGPWRVRPEFDNIVLCAIMANALILAQVGPDAVPSLFARRACTGTSTPRLLPGPDTAPPLQHNCQPA